MSTAMQNQYVFSNYVSFVVDSIEDGKQKILENLVL